MQVGVSKDETKHVLPLTLMGLVSFRNRSSIIMELTVARELGELRGDLEEQL